MAKPLTEITVDGTTYTYKDIMKVVPGISPRAAQHRVWKYKSGKIGKDNLLSPAMRPHKIGDEYYTVSELANMTGYTSRQMHERVKKYKKGEISEADLKAKKGAVEEKDLEQPPYDPTDRSPGWCERKYFRPTGLYDQGERCVL